MDLKGTEIKSFTVKGGPSDVDATPCDAKACTAACANTSGCVAVDIMKPEKINGEWNVNDKWGNAKCVCTLFSSVTSATIFQEIRGPGSLSGKSCMRAPKSPPPPMKEIPNFEGPDRRSTEQERMRPSVPSLPSTHRQRP